MEKQKNNSSSELDKEKLSGIERELVLQYLMDGNVPVTLTPLNEEKASESNEGIHPLASQIFPVALKPEHIKVQKNGKIQQITFRS